MASASPDSTSGEESGPRHIPVLTGPVLEVLAPAPGETVLDCTVGLGGHAGLLAERIGPNGQLVVFDLDPANLAYSRTRLESVGPAVIGFAESFSNAPRRMAELGLRADIALADLGFASSQMDDPARGLSFRESGPLDMRLDPSAPTTAADLLAALDERELSDLIYRFGEEPYARRIARKLAESRLREPITTTEQLAELVTEAYGPRAHRSRMHPATRTFMALRIAVNDELVALEGLLAQVASEAEALKRGQPGWLNRGARIAVISFHSLEDRLVKHTFADLAKRGLAERLTRKPLTAHPPEVQANPRARSAKLRAIRMITREENCPPTRKHGRPTDDS